MEFLLQLRKRGIQDTRVLRALETVPRERFVEAGQQDLAFADQALPICCGQTISQPYVVAAMTEALEVGPHHRVLEIGTGSGYQAAILARLAWEVVSIERYRTLAEMARARLAALGLNNVTVTVGDGTKGDPERAPFDRIIVTAATPEIPPPLLDQLAPDGILIAPVGPTGGVQQLKRLHKKEDGAIEERTLMAVRFVPLIPGQAATL
ncbi:MAG TPA: protein-L-isoaspartate(D-aspartate) O-methyltransferase [Xanthobacteraceae bacterium]|nr:protein-L-isoaspartate(D-aspartate) O-methyltransferase [Xanthobacteraceae bacterium]